MEETRIVIDEQKFRELVSGKIVQDGNVKIILQDIGWINMMDIIDDVMQESENKK